MHIARGTFPLNVVTSLYINWSYTAYSVFERHTTCYQLKHLLYFFVYFIYRICSSKQIARNTLQQYFDLA